MSKVTHTPGPCRAAFLILAALLAGCAGVHPVESELPRMYHCVMVAGDYAPLPRLPMAVTLTEESFAAQVRGRGMRDSTYGYYDESRDTIILSPRADRAALAHEIVHAFGLRHNGAEDDFARQMERDVRNGRVC